MEDRVEQVTREELISLVGNLGNFYNDIESGIIYSPYKIISVGRGYISKPILRLTNSPKQIVVEVRKEYSFFGEAVWDFIEQSGAPLADLAKIAGISPKTFYKVRDRKELGRTYSSKRKVSGLTSEEAIRGRILNIFNIRPPEKLVEIKQLPR